MEIFVTICIIWFVSELVFGKLKKSGNARQSAPKPKPDNVSGQPQSSKVAVNPSTHQTQFLPFKQMCTIDLFHGTPDSKNVWHIKAEGGSFFIGKGNNYGTGLYMTTNLSTAKQFAGRNGGILILRLQCPKDQIAEYAQVINSRNFKQWKSSEGIQDKGDAISAYCIFVLQKRFLKVNNEIYIALTSKTKEDERVRFQGIEILGCTDAKGRNLN